MTSYESLTSSANLTFDDEFNSFVSSPNGSVGWMTRYPYGGESARALPLNGEAEYYSDSSVGKNPFSINNGVLSITATPAALGSNPYGLPYTSGIITTYHSFAQEYGVFAIRAELPAGKGLWPAFWLLPDSNPYTTELDVFELKGGDPSRVYETIHSNTNTGAGTRAILNTVDTATSFNTFAVDWEPTTTTFYIDGIAVSSMATPANMDLPMYMLANLAVGTPGSFPGAPDSRSEFPASYKIDWVRAYASANTVAVSGTQAITGASVTGSVTLDAAGEPGVSVTLLDAAGNVLATTATDARGNFGFAGLAAGDYQVSYTAPAGLALQAGGAADPTTGLTPVITLPADQTVSLAAETLGNPNLGSISGDVLLANAALPGMTVTLLDANGNTLATTTTDSSGAFAFTGLAAGTYQVQYTAPSGTVLNAGSEADPTTGLTPVITLAPSQTVSLAAETLADSDSASISGDVLLGNAPLPGMTVTLLDANGNTLASATTDSGGAFDFTGLAAGTYQVQYTAPSGTVLDAGSGADPTTGLTSAITLAPGQTVSLAAETLADSDSASISGDVLLANAALPGMTVTLLDANGNTLANATTDSSGAFDFTGLAAGTYQVQYTAPSGTVLEAGSEADPTTGLTPDITLSYGQALTLANEALSPQSVVQTPGIIQGIVAHFGGFTDPLWGGGDGGVVVALLDATGAVVATTQTRGNGWYIFRDVAPGSYQMQYTTPAGQTIKPGTAADPTSGVSSPFTLAANQVLSAPQVGMVSALSLTGVGVTATEGDGSYVVTGDASDSTLTLGNGNQSVTLTGTGNTVVTGDGNQTITLSGSGNAVTVGTGISVIYAGNGDDVVQADGGNVTITADGGGNLFDGGSGRSLFIADGSAGNTFMLNPGGSATITTITGFNVAGDVLDLARTLSGTDILPDLSNVASFITSAVIGANTALWADPTAGSGVPQAFAILSGVQTNVAQLIAANDFSLA